MIAVQDRMILNKRNYRKYILWDNIETNGLYSDEQKEYRLIS